MQTRPDRYLSSSQQTLITVVERLSMAPLRPTTVEDLVGASPLVGERKLSRGKVYRALRNLEAAGWAEQSGGGWRLTQQVTLIAHRLLDALEAVRQRHLGPGGSLAGLHHDGAGGLLADLPADLPDAGLPLNIDFADEEEP